MNDRVYLATVVASGLVAHPDYNDAIAANTIAQTALAIVDAIREQADPVQVPPTVPVGSVQPKRIDFDSEP